jgi:hypothetical protein
MYGRTCFKYRGMCFVRIACETARRTIRMIVHYASAIITKASPTPMIEMSNILVRYGPNGYLAYTAYVAPLLDLVIGIRTFNQRRWTIS